VIFNVEHLLRRNEARRIAVCAAQVTPTIKKISRPQLLLGRVFPALSDCASATILKSRSISVLFYKSRTALPSG